MTTRKYKIDYTGPRRSLIELSNQEGSPCYECLVKGACTRSLVKGDACEKFIDYTFYLIHKEMKREKK